MKRLLLLLECLLPLLCHAKDPKLSPLPNEIYEGLSFNTQKLKTQKFPKRALNIADLGAKSDGETNNANIFQLAIDSLGNSGGGHVIVPQGVWLTGPITLKSNIDLHLLKGALIIFSDDKNLYPLVQTNFKGLQTYRCQSPISGRDLSNIAITGEGVIDGNGDAWRAVKRSKLAPQEWKKLIKQGGIVENDQWFPSAQYLKGKHLTESFNVPNFSERQKFEEIKDFLRPVMVSLINCHDVTLDGVSFQNSPAWCLHPLLCTNLRVSNITVRNPWYSQNGDGIDIDACRNTVIYNSSFDAGDDGICVKSGKDEDGRRQGVPCENLIVSHCTVFHGHGGFVVGSEMSGGVRNVSVKHCLFLGTDVGLRFKSCRGRGGIVENIFIDHVNMLNIANEPILFNLYYQGKGAESAMASDTKQFIPKADSTTPCFRNVYISNVTCKGAKRTLFFNGLPEMPIQNVVLQNLNISAKEGAEFTFCNDVEMRYCNLNASNGPLLNLQHVSNALLIEVQSASSKDDYIIQNHCDSIRLFGMTPFIKKF